MPNTSKGDAFALKNSGLDTFLFAEVGTELNGSSLTVLSTLARLGKDPWAQAAEWARMPSAAMVAGLTQSIVQMPLCPRALAEARATAARLVLLLPRQAGTTGQTAKTGQTASRVLEELKIPAWIPMAAFCIIMGLSIVAGTFAASPPTQAPVVQPAPVVQSPLGQ
jgi:hypothetical protein